MKLKIKNRLTEKAYRRFKYMCFACIGMIAL